jgi:hypothetical protein
MATDEAEAPVSKEKDTPATPASDAGPDEALFVKQPPTPFATVTHETVESVIGNDVPPPKHGKKKDMKRSTEKTEESK